MLKILIVGSLSGVPEHVGGTVVSLQLLVRELQSRNDVFVKLIDTSSIRNRKLAGLLKGFEVFFKAIVHIFSVDVVTVHVGIRALPFVGPIFLTFSRLLKKPIIIRRFGGVDHRELKGWQFWLAEKVIRGSDMYLVQTKWMIQGAKAGGLENVEWFPTCRPQLFDPAAYPKKDTECKKFIFIGQIKAAKGIFEIIDAAERFGPQVQVNVYGPFFEGLNAEIFSNSKRVSYCGVLPPSDVPRTLQKHDALLLPTYYPGEGYPGAILEAFNSGLPVISTKWKSIPEIVDESCGILIPTRNAESLYVAMLKLVEDSDLYHKLRVGAFERGRMFSLEMWSNVFVEYCRIAIEGRNVERS